jgi:IS605 OrfB family transposase
MITIKLPYKSEYDFTDLMKEYTILVKSVYNRILENKSNKNIRLYLKTLNNINNLDSKFLDNAILDAQGFQRENKIIFKRKNFFKRLKNKINKEEFAKNKYLPLVNYGEKLQKGNRKFQFDLNNNRIIFKLNRHKHIDIKLPKLKSNVYKQLFELQELMSENKICVSFGIDLKCVYITYQEYRKELFEFKDDRILGIDLNPNWIGLSILEFEKETFNIIYKSCIDLREINKYSKNKKNYELINISKQIINICKSYHVGNISIEELTMRSKEYNKGKKYNKLLNNDWNRNLLLNNLIKRCNIIGIRPYEINPAYTSFIGNLQYDYVDPINASIEIGRRGYLFSKLRVKNSFYPEFSLKNQWNQWKKDIGLFINDWKEFYQKIKTLDLKYRVLSLDELVYKQECQKRIKLYVFDIIGTSVIVRVLPHKIYSHH